MFARDGAKLRAVFAHQKLVRGDEMPPAFERRLRIFVCGVQPAHCLRDQFDFGIIDNVRKIRRHIRTANAGRQDFFDLNAVGSLRDFHNAASDHAHAEQCDYHAHASCKIEFSLYNKNTCFSVKNIVSWNHRKCKL